MAASSSPERRRVRAPSEAVHEDVGQELRAQREEKGLSLRELARRLGISPSALSQIETGKSRPSVSTLYSIVTELGISLDELFGGDQHARGRAREPADAPPRPAESHAEDSARVQRAATRHAIELQS